MDDKRAAMLDSVRGLEKKGRAALAESSAIVATRDETLRKIEEQSVEACVADVGGFVELAVGAIKAAADVTKTRQQNAENYARIIGLAKETRPGDVAFLLRMMRRTDDALAAYAKASSDLQVFYEEAFAAAKARVEEAA